MSDNQPEWFSDDDLAAHALKAEEARRVARAIERGAKAEATLATLMEDLRTIMTKLRAQAEGIGSFDDGHEWLCHATDLVQQAYAKAVQE